MPVWGALTGTLVLNYARHKAGKSTLCSSTRTHVSAGVFVAAWAALTLWLVPHYCRPLTKRPRN